MEQSPEKLDTLCQTVADIIKQPPSLVQSPIQLRGGPVGGDLVTLLEWNILVAGFLHLGCHILGHKICEALNHNHTQLDRGDKRAVGAAKELLWVSDMLGSQRGHAVEWQVCLAHLLRDATYAIECGDTAFSAAFKRLLLRAIAIGRRRDALKDITLTQYLADLDRRLSRIMAAVPIGEPGRKLRKRIAANRAHLFVFITNQSVPYTNNVSERHLRPSVIFRKVTNGFRCQWGAETYAAVRSLVSTAKANRASVLEVLRFVLATKLPTEPVPGVG